jgi:hypothetical protein
MDYRREIEDIDIRDAIELYMGEMTLTFLDLLCKDHDIALVQIEEARQHALSNIKNVGSEFTPIGSDIKSRRIAIALAEATFDMLRRIVQSMKDDEPPIGKPN